MPTPTLAPNPQNYEVTVEKGHGPGKKTVTTEYKVHQITDDQGEHIPQSMRRTVYFGVYVRVKNPNGTWSVYYLELAPSTLEGVAFARQHLGAQSPQPDAKDGYILSIDNGADAKSVEVSLALSGLDLLSLAKAKD